MIDINIIRNNKKLVKDNIIKKFGRFYVYEKRINFNFRFWWTI